MTKNEVQRVLAHMQGMHLLMAKMLYGAGLRLMECIRLRVQDLDFERNLIYVRGAKGNKDRTTLFPKSIRPEMRHQLEKIKRLHKFWGIPFREVAPDVMHKNIKLLKKEYKGDPLNVIKDEEDVNKARNNFEVFAGYGPHLSALLMTFYLKYGVVSFDNQKRLEVKIDTKCRDKFRRPIVDVKVGVKSVNKAMQKYQKKK